MFKTAAGSLKITHVPYKGTAPGLAALLAGEVEMMFDNLGVTVQHVRAGKLRALAVGSERRVPSLPEVPAMAEFYPGFVSIAWFSVSAPPKTPTAIAEKLSSAIAVGDRKSTRLNSSHQIISYAVFCLQKKTAYGRDTAARISV